MRTLTGAISHPLKPVRGEVLSWHPDTGHGLAWRLGKRVTGVAPFTRSLTYPPTSKKWVLGILRCGSGELAGAAKFGESPAVACGIIQFVGGFFLE